MAERLIKGTLHWLQYVPPWIWRLLISAAIGGIIMAVFVPWATAQRGFPALGGEYVLAFVGFILPQVIRR